MKRETFINFYESYHKGSYVPILRETNKNGFRKLTRIVVRFVNYYNIKSVIEKGTSGEQKARDYEEQIIPHVLKVNHNTNNTLLMVYKTNHHKAHTTYYHNDEEISEDEYYLGINEKKKKQSDTPLFMFKLEEVELA